MPLVSVLMPCYNAAPTIESAMRSVLRQTLTDFELIVIDDGSTDATPAMLDAYKSDPRIRVESCPHRGIVDTLNTGINLCQAPLIARMDADDISHPHRLECQLNYMMTHPEVAVCSCLVRMFPRHGLLGGLIHYEGWLNSLASHDDIARDLFVESPMAHPSVMMRRADLIELGGYQDHGWAEDYDLWLRYCESGRRFGTVKRTLVWWRHGPGRLTFTDSRYSVENFLRAKAHYIARRLLGCQRPILLWGAGKIGRRLLRHLLREGLEVQAVIDIDPRKIGRTMRGTPIVSREHLLSEPGAFIIAAVGSSGAREQIRSYLAGLGSVEIKDFFCAA
jgi:glycosyltransferase involved in cell wall biosynthesis